MFASKKTKRGAVGALVLVGLLTAAGVAYTDSITVAASKAGDGSTVVTAQTAGSLHYVLNTTNPANVDSVHFSLGAALGASGTVYVKADTAGAWYACTSADQTAWVCDSTVVTQLTAANVNTVRVVAAD